MPLSIGSRRRPWQPLQLIGQAEPAGRQRDHQDKLSPRQPVPPAAPRTAAMRPLWRYHRGLARGTWEDDVGAPVGARSRQEVFMRLVAIGLLLTWRAGGRVEHWCQGGSAGLSVAAPFGWRCLTSPGMPRTPASPHRTVRAVRPHLLCSSTEDAICEVSSYVLPIASPLPDCRQVAEAPPNKERPHISHTALTSDGWPQSAAQDRDAKRARGAASGLASG